MSEGTTASYENSPLFGKVMSLNEGRFNQCVIAPSINMSHGWFSILIYLLPREIIRHSKIITVVNNEHLLLVNTARNKIFVNLKKCRKIEVTLEFELGLVEGKWQLFGIECNIDKEICELTVDGRRLRQILHETTRVLGNWVRYPYVMIACHIYTDKDSWQYYFRGEIARIVVYYNKLNIGEIKELSKNGE
jgi:antitoxin component YwqK of YwqJK toxin-antitoxin module